jgi:hypothetical protein
VDNQDNLKCASQSHSARQQLAFLKEVLVCQALLPQDLLAAVAEALPGHLVAVVVADLLLLQVGAGQDHFQRRPAVAPDHLAVVADAAPVVAADEPAEGRRITLLVLQEV